MARTGYQYETSPRKIEPEVRQKHKNNISIVEQQRQKVKVSADERIKQVKTTFTIIAVFALLLTISYRNSQINEKFNDVQNLKKELSSLQKENEQTRVSIENSLNNNYIEQQAKEKLGMKKLTNKQTIYITLPKKDYVESPSEKVIIEEEKEKNWFEKIWDFIFNS